MGSARFSEEFKRDAVAQITERGYSVAEASRRLGVSTHSLYAWKKQHGSVRSADDGKDAEIRRLKGLSCERRLGIERPYPSHLNPQ